MLYTANSHTWNLPLWVCFCRAGMRIETCHLKLDPWEVCQMFRYVDASIPCPSAPNHSYSFILRKQIPCNFLSGCRCHVLKRAWLVFRDLISVKLLHHLCIIYLVILCFNRRCAPPLCGGCDFGSSWPSGYWSDFSRQRSKMERSSFFSFCEGSCTCIILAIECLLFWYCCVLISILNV